MSCEDFEMLMAGALGGELSSADRPRFERHLARCQTCRSDFETSRRALEEMRALPGSRKVTARREGHRLVIDHGGAADAPRGNLSPRWAATPLRYAAGLVIAFTAGYALHAGLTMSDAARTTTVLSVPSKMTGPSLQGSLIRAHARNPGRSDLAKCLIAMTATRR